MLTPSIGILPGAIIGKGKTLGELIGPIMAGSDGHR